MEGLLTKKYFGVYTSSLTVDTATAFAELKEKEWTAENFRFYTAVSVMSSAKIEGETLEIDSYLKHKLQDIKYLPNLIEKPNDLYKAYEFARDNELTKTNFLKAHAISTKHLLPITQRGKVRLGNMVIMGQYTNRIQYEAAPADTVKKEFDRFWKELAALMNLPLQIDEAFYFAALIHLVFVKIHPFNDGNGRTGRLLEKWFLSAKLGANAWYIGSEYYYFQNLQTYYTNLRRLGLLYEELKYDNALPFLLMLPQSLISNK